MNYDMDKLERIFAAQLAAARGTALHELAKNMIELGVKLEDTEQTLNMYVNDAIGFRMTPEQVLFYSDNAFGTADTLCFRDNLLRIHDLKTGLIPGSVHQLEVYAAFFCLEYRMRPFEIQMEFRIYQNDKIDIYEGDPDKITHIMETIKSFDKKISAMRMEAE